MPFLKRTVSLLFLFSLALAVAFAFVRDADRGLLRVASWNNSSTAFLIAAEDTPFHQLDLQGVQFALGKGSVLYAGPKDLPFIAINEKAFVQDPRSMDGGLVSSHLLYASSLAGLMDSAEPVAVYHLPPGNPVTLDDLYREIEKHYHGTFAIIGQARMVGDYAAPWIERVVNAMIVGDGLELPTTDALIVGMHRSAGEVRPGGPALRQTYGLILGKETVPDSGSTPEAFMEHLTALVDGGREIKTLSGVAPLAGASVLVFRVTELARYPAIIKHPLVDVSEIDPSIVVDLHYATPHNVAGKQIYPSEARAYLVAEAATRLREVNQALGEQGYRLKIYDAYRPLSAHRQLYSRVRDSVFLADPWAGSHHCRGAAVDCTLVTLDGREVEMPTDFDEFSTRAARSYRGASPEARQNSMILEQAMREGGFVPLNLEWWHFDAPAANLYPPLDVPL